MRSLYIIFIIFFVSCKQNTELKSQNDPKISNSRIDLKSEKYSNENLYDCPIDSLNMQTADFKEISFYTENMLRGKGVIQLNINNKMTIFNSDKTIFGTIDFKEDSYEMDLPSKIIAREVIPDSEFQIFSFDAELPDLDKENLIIYINGEKKLVAKKELKYNFLNWEDYIKSAFIQLTSDVENVNEDEQKYWFKTNKIKGDSIQIKSVAKASCDYVENYKDVTKWIKWKKNNCKLIKLNFCY